MATLIKEQLRNPVDNSWIPLREIEGDAQGKVIAIKQLDIDEHPLNYVTPEPGVMVPSDGTEIPVIPYPVGYKEGEITPIKTTYIFQDGGDVSLASPLALSNGTFIQETPATALKNLKIDATQTKDASVISISSGGTGASTAKGALNNLGITWGEKAAPLKGTPNNIYIQLLSAEG